MDTTDTNQIDQAPQIEELSHSDKMIGVFSEPAKTFQITSLFPTRTKDWVIPLLILFALIGIIRSISMMNEEVMYEAKKQQYKMIDEMVEKGTMTREQGDQALERIDQQMAFMKGPIGWVINIVSTMIFGFIFFFIIAGIYFLFIKTILKGDGTYQHTLVASGLTAYISMVQILVGGILTFVLGKIIMDTSIINFLDVDKKTILGFVLAKIDPISIWAYAVLGIAFAKLFKSKDTTKYIIMVFVLWILGGLLFFFLGKAFPFLAAFGG